jgi:hypothetical protein
MWIDRVCSAWLIRRFIDPRAKFVWFKDNKKRPKHALGFDFDGAEYTHVDSKVTFEVLLTSFGLDSDAGLARMGQLVHFLDVGGIPVAEAQGLAAIVAGARSLQPDTAQAASVTAKYTSVFMRVAPLVIQPDQLVQRVVARGVVRGALMMMTKRAA